MQFYFIWFKNSKGGISGLKKKKTNSINLFFRFYIFLIINELKSNLHFKNDTHVHEDYKNDAVISE